MRALRVAAVGALAACNGITAPCDTSERAGIHLSIVDSLSQTAVLVDSIKAAAIDDAYEERTSFSNLRPDPVTDVLLAMERAGVYEVQVNAIGYRPWRRDQIEVTNGRCHVNTAHITALLQRE